MHVTFVLIHVPQIQGLIVVVISVMNLMKSAFAFAAVFNEIWCHPCGPQDRRPC